MLYQTNQHNSKIISSLPSTPPHLTFQMEPLQNALKSSFIQHTSLKFNHHQQPLFDDLPVPTTFSTDDFSVDDLLDFSTMSNCNVEETESLVHDKIQTVTKTTEQEIKTVQNGVVQEKESSEICVPADDVADLEWLSHFVEDSFTEYSLTCALPPETTTDEASGKVTSRSGTKRARNGVLGLGWTLSPSETTLSSTSSSSSTTFSSTSTLLIYHNTLDIHNGAVFDSSTTSPPIAQPYTAYMKKKKFKSSSVSNKTAQPRRCSHCGVQKTPQWRAGPQGAKTLCNACGVRFKSGRLLPEYRPACSPTFSSKLHSNSHRKVLEMRHKKEVDLPESGSVPALSSF